jgi:hypothetical protein
MFRRFYIQKPWNTQGGRGIKPRLEVLLALVFFDVVVVVVARVIVVVVDTALEGRVARPTPMARTA